MKTTLLILLSTCLGVLAQTSVTGNDPNDVSVRDELRALARGEQVTNATATQGVSSGAAATVPVTAVPATQPATTPPGSLGIEAAITQPAIATGPLFEKHPTPAPDEGPDEATNDFEASGIDVPTFLDIYAGLVGRTLLHGPNLPQGNLTLITKKKLTKSQLIEAMTTVLSLNGITVVNEGDNFLKAVPIAESIQTAPVFSTVDGKELPDSDQYVVQVLPVKYVKPADMTQILLPFSKTGQILSYDDNHLVIIRDNASNIKRMLELAAQVDVEVPSEFESEVIPIKYAQAEDIANALSSLGGSTVGGISGTSRSGGTGRSGAPAPGGLGGGANNPGGIGAPGGNASPAAPAVRNQTFTQRLQQAVQGITGGSTDFKLFTGVTKIMPDGRANNLLVFANNADMRTIKKLVNQLDQMLPQVLIQALILEVTLDNSQNVGVSYLQVQPTTARNFVGGVGLNNGQILDPATTFSNGTNGLGSLASGLTYAAQFGGNFDATVTAAANDSRINVLSRPTIQTSQGKPAEFKIGDTVPYINQTYANSLVGGLGGASYTQEFVGIDLNVSPLINSDGLVTMDITQDIQQLGPTTEINGSPVPSTTERYAQTSVSVRDRQTVILGGFISSQKSKALSGVPVLMNIPLLGALFRSSNDSFQKDELIVLIRPTVLTDAEAAAEAAKRERDRLPLTKEDERDFQVEQNKELKSADSVVVPEEWSK